MDKKFLLGDRITIGRKKAGEHGYETIIGKTGILTEVSQNFVRVWIDGDHKDAYKWNIRICDVIPNPPRTNREALRYIKR